MSCSYVLGPSDMFFLYLKPFPRQYKLNQEKCSFFPTISGVVMPTDTRQLCCAGKTTDKPLDSNSDDTSCHNPCFPTNHLDKIPFIILCLKTTVQFWWLFCLCCIGLWIKKSSNPSWEPPARVLGRGGAPASSADDILIFHYWTFKGCLAGSLLCSGDSQENVVFFPRKSCQNNDLP